MKRMLFARVDNFSKTVGVHVVPDIILISKVCEKNFGHMTHHVIEFHSLSSVLFTPLTSAYIATTIDRIVFAVASFLHFFFREEFTVTVDYFEIANAMDHLK